MTTPAFPHGKRYLKVYLSGSNRKPYDGKAGSVALFTFSRAVFGRGLEITRDLSIAPGFIKSWAWDFTDAKYVLKVDTSITFHGGRHITADDVEFMLVKSNLSPINLKARKWLMNIQGLSELKPGQPYRSGQVSGIRVTSPDTIEIKLAQPNPAFLFNLGRSIPSLVPRELVSTDLINFIGSPVGVGDFKVQWDDPKSTAVRLEQARALGPKAPEIVDLVNEGDGLDADIVIGPRVNPKEGKFTPVLTEYAVSLGRIDFNYENEAGRNPDFRAAIYHALNRKEITKDYPFFEPAWEHLVKGMVGRINTSDPYDPPLAKTLVERLPTSIRSHPQTVFFYGKLEWNPYVKIIEDQLAAVGLSVKFISVNGEKIRLDHGDAKVAMWMGGQMADFLDPLNCFAEYLPGANNSVQYPQNDKQFSVLFENAMRAESLNQRSMSLQALSRYFLAQHIAVLIMEQRLVFWIDLNKVEGLDGLAGGSELNLSGVKVK